MGFEIEKALFRATTVENCMKSMQIRDLAGPSKICHITRGSDQDTNPLHLVFVCLEVFERNLETWQHPQEREECVRRGHN